MEDTPMTPIRGFVPSLPRPRLTAPPQSSATTPAEGQSPSAGPGVGDQTAVSSSPTPPGNPWPGLERAGLVGAGNVTSGPIGHALNSATRQGLLDALVRLQGNGVTFERRRSWFRVPFTRKHAPMTVEKTIRHLEIKGSKDLEVSHGDRLHQEVNSLEDIRGLDVAYGMGDDAAAADERTALDALHDLEAAGFQPTINGEGRTTPFESWRQIHANGGLMLKNGGKQTYVTNRDQLVLQDYLVTGHDHGVHDKATADLVKQAQAAGLAFPNTSYYSSADATIQAIESLSANNEIRVGLAPDRPVVGVKRADLGDLATVRARIDQAEDLYKRILAPVLGDNPNYHGELLDFCTAQEQRFSPAFRAAMCATVARGIGNRVRDEQVIATTRKMEDLAADDLQLAWVANRWATTARKEGVEQADSLLATLGDGLLGRTASRVEAEQLRPILFKLLDATGSLEACSEGLDLVRVAIGKESQEDRIKLFTDIAAYESQATLPETAAHYRAVMVHRRPDEPLMQAGQTFVEVLKTLTLGRNQARAVEVFTTLQDGLSKGRFGSKTVEEVLAEFGQAVTLGRSIDDALAALEGKGAGNGISAGPATVEKDGDSVVIGGIRIPRAPQDGA
jgi:hypothetical protein